MTRRRPLIAAAVLLLSIAGPEALAAETTRVAGLSASLEGPMLVAPPRRDPAWGTTAHGVRSVHALGFQEAVSTMGFDFNFLNTHRFRTSGATNFDFALADLPAGAVITGIELQACDSNGAASAEAFLFRLNASNSALVLGSVSTGNAESPGCGFFGGADNLGGTHVVDNYNNSYFIRASLDAGDTTTTFGAVRVFYKLQVSPAPGAATFADVPTTHPFFRFVEALVDAGITAGCGGGNYCVDSPITRGEMAVFLSVALGLHFPY